MPVVESFYGYVETTKDSLLLLEACRQGVLPRVTRRLQEQERHLVKSGAVFCFDENESGIKRWTDGLVWSPSRILGNFLIYRELGDRTSEQDDNTQQITSGLTLLSKRQREKSLLGSLRNSYQFKPNGLIKKSMSVVINGVHQHLVSYYNKEDVLNNKFRTPSTIPELATLTISTELLYDQHFRIPFLMEGETNGTKLEKRPTRQKRRSASYGFSNPPPRRQYSNSSSSSGNSNNSSNNSIVSDTSVGSSIPTPTLDTSFLSTPSTYNWTQDDLPQPDTTTLSSTKAAFMDPSPDTTLFSPPSCHHPPTHTISYSQHQPPFSIDLQQRKPTTFMIPSPRTPCQEQQQSQSQIFSSGVGSYAQYQPWVPENGRSDQNPHQHLFSSSSFHTINHASLHAGRTTELVSNAFMLDTSALIGFGWNDMELQM